MAEAQLPEIAQDVADVVRTVILQVRPRLIESALSGSYLERENERHADNFLSAHDLWLHRRYRELLRERIPAFVYASEEADPEVIGGERDPDLVVLVDPLDTSELAVRGLLGYTHVLVYSRALARPVAAVVGDLFHHVQLYLAARDGAGVDRAYVSTADGVRRPIGVKSTASLPDVLVTNYLMRPAERFTPLARQTRLLEALSSSPSGRIGVDFGSVSLCHVATGATEATVEFAKGFAVWDLAPGHYILCAAGGSVVDLAGRPLPLDLRLTSMADVAAAMNRRQRFVAAATPALAYRILDLIDRA